MAEKLSTAPSTERKIGRIREFAIAKCRRKMATRENLIANLELLKRYINQVDFKFTPVSWIPWTKMWKGSRYQEWVGKVFSRAPLRKYDQQEVSDWQTNPRYQYVPLIDRFIEIIRDTPVGEITQKISDCIDEVVANNPEIDYSSFLSQMEYKI